MAQLTNRWKELQWDPLRRLWSQKQYSKSKRKQPSVSPHQHFCVDDTFAIVRQDQVGALEERLNGISPDVQLTMELEKDKQRDKDN